MPDLVNCAGCGKIMVRNQFRDICQECYTEEERQFEVVYKFMRKRQNRAATMEQVVEATGVSEELILKFIKSGRIQVTQFPNLGYPCDKCGAIIQKGKLCDSCTNELRSDMLEFERDQEFKEQIQQQDKERIYLSKKNRD
ncbi:TIGR03826 family flagellar region protein [Niallia sp. Krafla_26]|uniref:TIGR03826 family flagellar region protein n=1 Tax=Niallia sp. Krafla_26 TaxID=3064703 RepID=UPI003D17EE86